VPDEDGAEISLVADATELELLKPSPGQARQKQRKVLDDEVIVGSPGPHGEAVVLEPMVRVGLAIVLGDVCRWLESPRVGGHPDRRPKCLGPKVIHGGTPPHRSGV
jgi:hypothetical protein